MGRLENHYGAPLRDVLGEHDSGLENKTVSAKKKKFDAIMAEVEKEYGAGVVRQGEQENGGAVEVISSGVFSVDTALGCGGFPRGRICEIFGPPSHGKTSLLLKTISSAQTAGFDAAYVDAEFSFLPAWGRAQGVNTDSLIVIQPNFGEECLDVVEKFVVEGIDLLVVDSVEGLVPRAELDGEMADSHMGLRARMMGQALRKLAGAVSRSNSCLLFINQTRNKIGVVFGNPETTGGGQALTFWSSVRMRVSRKEVIKEGDVKVGIRAQAEIVKNKVAPAFLKSEFDIYSGQCGCHAPGIDVAGDLLDAGVAAGVIEKSGSWFAFNGERLGQGRIASSDAIRATPALAEAVRFAILKSTQKRGEETK